MEITTYTMVNPSVDAPICHTDTMALRIIKSL